MKTHTSKKIILVKTILVIPLIALLLFSFSTKEEISRKIDSKIETFSQDIATEKMVKEYNKLAKKYNSLPKKERTISREELGRMVYIFDRMTKEQRNSSEKFPEIVIPKNASPPPMPTMEDDMQGVIPPPPPPPPLKEIEEPVIIEVVEHTPPPPPPPVNSADFMKMLSKEGAVFFYEEKQITGKEAFTIASKNKEINIQVKDRNSKKPVVKLSKDPIVVD